MFWQTERNLTKFHKTFSEKAQESTLLLEETFVDMMRFQLVMEVIEKENLVENARIVGEYLLAGLQNLAHKYPEKLSNARGRGLMCAIDLPTPEQRNHIRELLYDDGLIILACGDQSIRFRPHLNVTKEEIQIAIDKIENNINKI